jgi:hypothetical protein
MLQQHKTKEIDFHNKLNELQAKIEDYEVIDIDEYINEFCKDCNDIRFKSKVNYGLFTSGWISASIGCSFYFPTASILSVGLSAGTLISLSYQAYNSFI